MFISKITKTSWAAAKTHPYIIATVGLVSTVILAHCYYKRLSSSKEEKTSIEFTSSIRPIEQLILAKKCKEESPIGGNDVAIEIDESIQAPNLITQYMDIATIDSILRQFLTKLKQNQQLLTKKEFFVSRKCRSRQWIKKDNVTRIFGVFYLSNFLLIEKFKFVKVPEKVMLLLNKDGTFTFTIPPFEDNLCYLKSDSDEVEIYVENISSVDRYLSREEVLELFKCIEIAHYTDLRPSNFIISNEGIYIIDTEFKSFSDNIEWHKLTRLENFIKPEDRNWFFQMIQEKQQQPKQQLLSSHYYSAKNVVNVYQTNCAMKQTVDERFMALVCKSQVIVQKCLSVGSHKNRTLTFSINEL